MRGYQNYLIDLLYSAKVLALQAIVLSEFWKANKYVIINKQTKKGEQHLCSEKLLEQSAILCIVIC